MAEIRSDSFHAGFLTDGTYFEQMGEGAPIVFIHGLGCDVQMWVGITALSNSHLTITYDLIGHGRSQRKWDLLTFDAYVEQLANLLRERKLTGATLVGFSIGGAIAIRMAERYPSLVKGVILSNVPFRRTKEELAGARKRIDRVRAEGLPAVSSSLVLRWFPEGFLRDREDLLLRLKDMLCRNQQDAFIAAYNLALDGDELLERACPSISFPCMVIAGTLDTSVGVHKAKELAASLNNATFVVFEEAGHMIPIQAASAFVEELRKFCRVTA
jgi:pimeloyl-ACP methyl ester carboxylesterase